jgi:hypothetical protein
MVPFGRTMLVSIAALIAAPALAQETPLSSFSTAIGTSTSSSHALGDSFRDAYGPGAHRPAASGARPGLSRPVPPAMPLQTALARLSYKPDPAAAKAAMDEYVQGLRRTNPSAAPAAEAELRRADISRIYLSIVGPLGLKDGNLADAYAAYNALGWTIINGAPDPTAEQARGLRDQLAPTIAARAPSGMAGVGELLKIRFVTLFSGWQEARKEGKLAQYASGIDRLFTSQGLTLNGIKLTPTGFHP